jgi:hypothetical protein
MNRKPYPWRAVQTVRENQETAAKQLYQERATALERAQVERESAAQEVREKENAVCEWLEALRAFSHGCLAAEAQRFALYVDDLRRQTEVLKKREREAQASVRTARERLEQARTSLQQSRADRKVLESHRDGFEAGQKKRVERRAELETEELWTARRRRS